MSEKPQSGDKPAATEPTPKQAPLPRPSSAGAKVVVACKLPNGLVLHLDEMIEKTFPTPTGGTFTVKEAVRRPETVRVYGNAVPHGTIPDYLIVGGYALTPDVDKDFFDAWLAQNKSTMVVSNGLIFAYERSGDAADVAREKRSIRSGLEPLTPDSDPRTPRQIKTADEQKRRSA